MPAASLFEAMCGIAETGKGPAEQQASMGLLDQVETVGHS